MDSYLGIWRMFANWWFRRAHLLMWVCMNGAPNRLAFLQLNTSLSMARSSWLRQRYVDSESIEWPVSLWRSKRRCDFVKFHRSNTRMRPSSRGCFSTKQRGSKDLFNWLVDWSRGKTEKREREKKQTHWTAYPILSCNANAKSLPTRVMAQN